MLQATLKEKSMASREYVLRSVTFDAYSYFRIELLTLNDVPLPIWGRETAKRENKSTSSPQLFFMKIRLHEHPLSKKILRTVDPSHERSICISASPIVRLKQTEREIQLIISSSPSMNCPSKKSSPETQSRKE